MKRNFALLSVLALTLTISAFGQIIDPVGFCATGSTGNTCFTGTGFGNETIAVGTTSFQMEKNGTDTASSDPWYLLVAVPEDTAGSATAPVITSDGSVFTQNGTTTDAGAFSRTASGDIYAFAGLTGDNSMNAPNMFCDGGGDANNVCTTSNEISAFGSEPQFFEIFVYSFSPAFIGNFTPYTFTVASPGLVGGTFLAASGGSQPFSTPYTTTGLAQSSSSSSTDTTVGSPSSGPEVPEPNSIVLLGTALLAAGTILRKKLVRQ